MSEPAGNNQMKKWMPWCICLLACTAAGMRIAQTLPPGREGVKAKLAQSAAAFHDGFVSEYGVEPDIASALNPEYGKAEVVSGIDPFVPGMQFAEYTLSAYAVDGSLVTESFPLKYTVADTQAPEILLKNEYETITVGTEYDPFENIVSVSDPADGELIKADALDYGTYTVTSEVNTSRPGAGIVTVQAKDINGLASSASWPVTVERVSLAEGSTDESGVPKIALKDSKIRLETGSAFSAEDVLLAVTDADGSALKYSDELKEGTYTFSTQIDTSSPAIRAMQVSAMSASGDTAYANVTVFVGSDEEIAEASGVSADTNYGRTYLFLTGEMGLNRAAACGIMANISRESGFRPEADNAGLYHGLCQWGEGRLSRLYDWCYANGFEPDSLEGQLNYMRMELEGSYAGVLAQLRAVENTADGAYQAGAVFGIQYEGAAWVAESAGASAAAMFAQ